MIFEISKNLYDQDLKLSATGKAKGRKFLKEISRNLKLFSEDSKLSDYYETGAKLKLFVQTTKVTSG